MKNWNKLFALLFFSTGIFAIVGSIFTWGEGWLFIQPHKCNTLLPWADLILTAPLSLTAAYGIWARKKWWRVIGSMTCGVYLFGSVLVYLQIFWEYEPFTLQLLIPPVFGLGIVCAFLVLVIKHPSRMES